MHNFYMNTCAGKCIPITRVYATLNWIKDFDIYSNDLVKSILQVAKTKIHIFKVSVSQFKLFTYFTLQFSKSCNSHYKPSCLFRGNDIKTMLYEMICMSYFPINALVEQATVITNLIGILIIVRLILKRMFSIVFKVPL